MRRLTAHRKLRVAVRMHPADRERWYLAAKIRGVSQSEFFRVAVRETADRVIAADAEHRAS